MKLVDLHAVGSATVGGLKVRIRVRMWIELSNLCY